MTTRAGAPDATDNARTRDVTCASAVHGIALSAGGPLRWASDRQEDLGVVIQRMRHHCGLGAVDALRVCPCSPSLSVGGVLRVPVTLCTPLTGQGLCDRQH